MLKKLTGRYLILVLILALAILQGAFLPINLVLLTVLVWSIVKQSRDSLLVAFLAGVFLDMAVFLPLGSSSLIFLLVVFFVTLYSRKFDPSHPAFLAIFIFISVVLYNLMMQKPWLVEAVLLTGLSMLLRPVLRKYSADFDRDSIKLKV